MNKQENPPNLTDVLKNLKRDVMLNINCVNLGIIQAFDPANQTATVQIALKKVKNIEPDGTRIIADRPLLLQCPVVIMSGGDTYMTFPISVGDECLVLFNDREIDNFWQTGAVSTPSTPRVHDISDGIVLVGIRSLQNLIDEYLTNGIRISHLTAKIDVLENRINSLASLFHHTGDMETTGDMTVGENLIVEGATTLKGNVFGNGGTLNLDADLQQTGGRSIHAGNGASGTFDVVTVVDGIVTGGS